METVLSLDAVPIRLTDERWRHIVEEHSELSGLMFEVLETVSNPDEVLAGNFGERLAIRRIRPGKNLVVVYRENSPSDGFVITAFLSRRTEWQKRRKKKWPSLS